MLASGKTSKGFIMKILTCLMVGIGLVAILYSLLMPGSTLASPEFLICNVPDDYGTIQSAVNESSCEEVIVANRTYFETLTTTRTVNIKGQGTDNTTIDGFANACTTLGPGINAGDPNGCKNHQGQLLATDQSGMPRVGRCDIGAYEYQGEFHQVFIPMGFNNFCTDFFDDFSNSLSGWPIGEDDYVRFGYLGEEYQIRTKTAGFFYLFSSPSCDRENYVAEVDARWVGIPGSGYGILFGIAGDFDQYYLFDINTDFQMYRLLYRNPSGWEVLISPTTSTAINSGNATNHLKVIRNGTEITLGVNGTTLRVVNDNRISGLSGAGIVSQPYDTEPNSDVRFDNFSMTTLVANSGNSIDVRVAIGSNGPRSNWNYFDPSPRDFDWGMNLKN